MSETFKISSRMDRLLLEVLVTEPPEGTNVRAVLQISHGMSEHKERYQEFMEAMSEKGVACIIHDHRGHGASVGSEEDLGYMYGGGSRALVEDLHQITAYAKRRWSGLPFYLLGHSMGSLVVRTYLKKYDGELDGVILTGSPSKNDLLDLGMLLGHGEALILGRHHRSKLLEALTFGPFAARFPKEKCRFAWCCANPEIQKAYEEDPHCGFTFTADGFFALGELMKETYGEDGWQMHHPELPILFLSGEEDPCYQNRKKFAQAIEHLRKQGYRNVQGKLYPGMRHEILFEQEKQKVYHDVCRWMKLDKK